MNEKLFEKKAKGFKKCFQLLKEKFYLFSKKNLYEVNFGRTPPPKKKEIARFLGQAHFLPRLGGLDLGVYINISR